MQTGCSTPGEHTGPAEKQAEPRGTNFLGRPCHRALGGLTEMVLRSTHVTYTPHCISHTRARAHAMQCRHVSVHTHVCAYTCMCVHMCTREHAHTCMHMCACTQTGTHTALHPLHPPCPDSPRPAGLPASTPGDAISSAPPAPPCPLTAISHVPGTVLTLPQWAYRTTCFPCPSHLVAQGRTVVPRWTPAQRGPRLSLPTAPSGRCS